MPRKVLVTGGGGGGIGKAIAAAFHAAGDDVYVCDIDAAALEQAAAAFPGLITQLCDIGDRGQIEAMVADAIEKLGGLDVLVNNAGIAGPTAKLCDGDPDQWERVLRINLTGTFNVTRNAIAPLVASGRGVIIIMSSAAGRFGYPNRSPYSTAKWGLIGMTKTLSMELGEHNVRVNAILPGAVDGDRIQHVFRERARAAGTSIAEIKSLALANPSLKYLVDAEALAALAMFLASDAARSVSGQIFPVYGDMQRN